MSDLAQSIAPLTLRQATANDWTAVRAIRLEALAAEPGKFGSNLARETALAEPDWRNWAAGPGSAVFLLFDADTVVGLTGVITLRDDPAAALCIASYLRPAYRGRGLSRAFYECRIAWARAAGFRRIVTSHRLSNTASMQANQRFGFREINRVPHVWPDGANELDVIYELPLNHA